MINLICRIKLYDYNLYYLSKLEMSRNGNLIFEWHAFRPHMRTALIFLYEYLRVSSPTSAW